MTNWLGSSLQIGLSKTTVTLLRTNGWLRSQTRILDSVDSQKGESFSEAGLLQNLIALLARSKNHKLPASVVVSDEWVRLFMVTPPNNTTRIDDCRSAALMRFQTLYDEPAINWQLEADWNPLRPFLVCAMQRELLETIVTAATEYRLKLIRIEPHFITSWNRWHASLKKGAWFGVAFGKQLTLGIINQQRLVAVRSIAVPEGGWNNLAWLPIYLGREAMRMSLHPSNYLQLCGAVTAQWVTQEIGPMTCSRLDAGRGENEAHSASNGIFLASAGIC